MVIDGVIQFTIANKQGWLDDYQTKVYCNLAVVDGKQRVEQLYITYFIEYFVNFTGALFS